MESVNNSGTLGVSIKNDTDWSETVLARPRQQAVFHFPTTIDCIVDGPSMMHTVQIWFRTCVKQSMTLESEFARGVHLKLWWACHCHRGIKNRSWTISDIVFTLA